MENWPLHVYLATMPGKLKQLSRQGREPSAIVKWKFEMQLSCSSSELIRATCSRELGLGQSATVRNHSSE
eukprot:1158630-Pelagomonas_calceolata.AAC.10